MHAAIARRKPQLVELCRQFGVLRLDAFGSAARGRDFDAARSDVDLLVQFPDTAFDSTLFLDFKDALEAVLGRSVDLVERQAVESSRNTIRRGSVLSGAQEIYAD